MNTFFLIELNLQIRHFWHWKITKSFQVHKIQGINNMLKECKASDFFKEWSNIWDPFYLVSYNTDVIVR